MDYILADTGYMLVIIVVACLIVLMAMCVDLVSGVNKARMRGEARTSFGLKRTVTKFILYEGGMVIAAGIDLLIHYSRLFQLLNLNVLYGVPIVTCLLGIFLLVVEGMSVKEKADDKTRIDMAKVEQMARVVAKMLDKEQLAQAITAAIANEIRTKETGKE